MMASKIIIPQAIITLPGNTTRNPPPSVVLPRRSAGGFEHAARNRGLVAGIDGLVMKRREFVVRAEGVEAEGSEVVDEEVVEGEGEVVESEGGEAEVEGDGEDKVVKDWKPRVKLGDVMGILNKRAIEASDKVRPTPDIRTGDVVEIKLEVPENRRRLSIFKGIVISKQNAGIHTTIRIRRIIAGVGVEIVFPVYSPNIKEIKVVSHRKVRRARLYYLRDKLPRLSTFK
ncbi:hypothetical protein MLD38_015484 [Melastoma candidum]|uniref:Uncharacterized protein n=1 Tax=Melastoma candidum TaxID=119954 RepID=A0ACB9RJC8_9MYRT|nr:hypothetical protein MLD38_015484 [Melastoma candidum]